MDGLVEANGNINNECQQVGVNHAELLVDLRRERQNLRSRQQGRDRRRALVQKRKGFVESLGVLMAEL